MFLVIAFQKRCSPLKGFQECSEGDRLSAGFIVFQVQIHSGIMTDNMVRGEFRSYQHRHLKGLKVSLNMDGLSMHSLTAIPVLLSAYR